MKVLTYKSRSAIDQTTCRTYIIVIESFKFVFRVDKSLLLGGVKVGRFWHQGRSSFELNIVKKHTFNLQNTSQSP